MQVMHENKRQPSLCARHVNQWSPHLADILLEVVTSQRQANCLCRADKLLLVHA